MLPETAALHLLTRHSVREQSSSGFADYRLALTAEGVAMAEAWGGRLDRPVTGYHSSPVQRCVDTALALRRGAARAGLSDAELAVERSPLLVEPGSYVRDVNLAGPLFFRLGAVGFINRHLAGEADGVLSAAEGRAQLVEHFLATNPGPGELAVHVTHDTILAAFVAGLHGHRAIREEDWPWMMEGVWLWFEAQSVHWIWRAEQGSLPLPEALAGRFSPA
jgi:broad specificity phosphatase PhoE